MNPLTLLLPLLTTVLDRVMPSKTEADKIKLEQAKAELNVELQKTLATSKIAEGQIEINKAEAIHSDVFVSGARPFILWVCGISLACFFIPQYLIGSYFWVIDMWTVGHVIPYPLNTQGLMELVYGMLGLGAYRTVEKVISNNKKQ
jgi:hypothetical protein